MCGSYGLNQSPQMLMLYFVLGAQSEWFSNSEARPTNTTLIVRINERPKELSQTVPNLTCLDDLDQSGRSEPIWKQRIVHRLN